MKQNKNILFFMTDHQRFDTMGMVQCGREVTPNLNRLAEEGMVFERAYDTCPLCVPAELLWQPECIRLIMGWFTMTGKEKQQENLHPFTKYSRIPVTA